MKVLIAYDGSKYSEAALDDLALAGLPSVGEATIISVAEVWLPPADGDGDEGYHFDETTQKHIEGSWTRGQALLAAAAETAEKASKRIKLMLPGWKVDSAASYGSPAWAILAKADEIGPDLIIVGSQGRSAIGRFVLGSISQKVVTEARCSVRVGRGRIEIDAAPARLLIAFDGSQGAFAAVQAVASRSWPQGSEMLILCAAEVLAPSALGGFLPPVGAAVDELNASEMDWLEEKAAEAVAILREKGMAATVSIQLGNAKQVLLREAEGRQSDCIFLGANKFGSWTERFLLGSTSAAVAARAHCSVEVVRKSE